MNWKTTCIAAAAAAALAGCGSQASAPPKASPAPSAMTLVRACRALRADMIANGGMADRPTLRRIASQLPGTSLAEHATRAEPDVGNGNLWWIDAALIAHDCQSTGVQIPTGT